LSIGEELRQAREQIGASLADVEQETKIRAKYIAAIEEDDFDALPGKAYVKGFLRVYGRLLGLNEDDLVSQYEEQQFTSPSVKEEEELQAAKAIRDTYQPLESDEKPKALWRIMAVALVIIIGALLVYRGATSLMDSSYGLQDDDQGVDTSVTESGEQQTGAQTTNESDAEAPKDDGIAAPAATEELKIVLQASGLCWVSVVVDNKEVFNGNLNANDVKEFVGQNSIFLNMGNAGAVKISLNGKDYGFLGAQGEVVTKTFTKNDILPPNGATGI